MGFNGSDGRIYVAHPQSADRYRYYFLDHPFTGNWGNASGSSDSDSVTSTNDYLASAAGLVGIFFSHHEFSSIERLNNGAVTYVGAGVAGDALAIHLDRVFSGGTTTEPYRVHYSDIGDPNTWGATAFFDVGPDDGEGVRAMAVFNGGLLIGKDTSLWFLSGTGPSTFRLDRLDAGGAAPGNTIIPTPYGAVVAGQETVWLFNGSQPVPMSRAIENTYSFSGKFMSGAYLDGKVYIADEGTGTTFVYNFETQAWHLEKSSSANESPVVYATVGGYLLGGSKSSTTASLVQQRRFPADSRGRDSAHAETFKLNTPEIWLAGPLTSTARPRVYLQIRQRGGDSTHGGLVVTPYRNGVAGNAQTIAPKDAAQVFRHRLDFRGDAYSLQLRFAQTVAANEAALMDIEGVVIEYDGSGDR
jgi:hypothetical protein